jgi:putative aldouronate transport system substrate-binding protein
MGQHIASGSFDRRLFLRGAAFVGAAGLAPWLISACSNGGGSGSGGGGGEGLGSEFFEVPSDQLAELSEDMIPADQQQMTVEQWVAKAEGAFDPPIDISTITRTSTPVKFPDGDSIEDNVWTRAYESKYGVKVTTQFAVDQSQWEQRVNLMIGSGDLPDFFEATQAQLDQLVRADLVQDLAATFRDHASDRVRAIMLEGGPIPLQSAVYDGKLMALPFTEQKETAPLWFIRKDWLDNLGLPVPETLDDLLATAEAFTTQDPDGQGTPGRYGIAVGPQGPRDLAYLEAFWNGYHAYRGIWVEKDGKLVYGSVQPEMKAALARLQEAYDAGLLHPELGTITEESVFEDWGTGRVGIMQGRGSATSGTDVLKDAYPDADIIAIPCLSIDSDVARVQVNQPNVRSGGGYWVVRKGYEHPEALLKLLDFWVDTFYFTPSDEVQEVFNSDGVEPNFWTLNKIATYRAYKNTDAYLTVTKLLDEPNPNLSDYRPEPRFWYEQIKPILDGQPFTGVQYRGYVGYYGPNCGRAVQDLYRTEDRYMSNQFYGVPTRTMSQRKSSMDSLEAETFAKIIVGTSPIDDFDTFVEEWGGIGGDEVTDEVNEWRAQQA